MSKSGELWLNEVERIADGLAGGRLSHDEAVAELRALGFDPIEAHEMACEHSGDGASAGEREGDDLAVDAPSRAALSRTQD